MVLWREIVLRTARRIRRLRLIYGRKRLKDFSSVQRV